MLIFFRVEFLFISFSAFLGKKPVPWICRADLNALFWSRAQINVIFYYMLVTVIVVKYSIAQMQCFLKTHTNTHEQWFLFEYGKLFIFSQL